MIFADFIKQYKPRFFCDESVAEFELLELLCHVMKMTRTELLLSVRDEIPADKIAELETLVERLILGEPLSYVLGETVFRGETFVVEPGVLAPRPETEELVGLVLDFVKEKKLETGSLIECGAGSGVIGLSLAKELSGFDVEAWDISEVSQRVVQKNKERLGVNNFSFRLGDFLKLSGASISSLKAPRILVSNPPYITRIDMSRLDLSVLNYEPEEALTDNGDGLAFYRFFSTLTSSFDALFFECGESQAQDIVQLFGTEMIASVVQDMFGKDRFVVVRNA